MPVPGDNSELNAAAAAADTAPSTDGGCSNRKRRMSKRERKNLKKKKSAGGGHQCISGDGDDEMEAAKLPPSSSAAASTSLPQQKSQPEQPSLDEYMSNYIPPPSLPTIAARERGIPTAAVDDDEDNSKSLGKWFPKASVIKSSVCYSNDYLAKLAKDKKKKQGMNNNTQQNKSTLVENKVHQEEPKASLVLFYQYVNPPWSQSKVSSFLSYLTSIAKNYRTNIGGRIRVSTEGINATVSAASTNNNNLEPGFEAAQTLRHFTQDLRHFDPKAFEHTDFKFIDGLSADRHFKELKLLPVKELVFYGIREWDCALKSAEVAVGNANHKVDDNGGGGEKNIKGGIHLNAQQYHEMLKQKDAVVIDVRNHYEAAIGRFDGQMDGDDGDDVKDNAKVEGSADDDRSAAAADPGSKGGGAAYIDPKMRKSTDFSSWLAEPETKRKLEGKTVMMFCTGGIRCERASAYLNSQMGSDVKGVYQLQGGVERYLQAFPEGGFWRGKNFVFDKREAIGPGNVNGDGGVVRGNSGSSESSKLTWGTECANCHRPWDRYVGKRKCYTCGVPVLVCDTCMSFSNQSKKKKRKEKMNDVEENDKKAGSAKKKEEETKVERVRCPLCVEEGVTVPAEDVEFTDNGKRGRLRLSSEGDGGTQSISDYVTAGVGKPRKKGKGSKDSNHKAAKSVLKWGGGHATRKKEKRKYSRRPCQFGVECVRKDCFFYHPEREKNEGTKKGAGR